VTGNQIIVGAIDLWWIRFKICNPSRGLLKVFIVTLLLILEVMVFVGWFFNHWWYAQFWELEVGYGFIGFGMGKPLIWDSTWNVWFHISLKLPNAEGLKQWLFKRSLWIGPIQWYFQFKDSCPGFGDIEGPSYQNIVHAVSMFMRVYAIGLIWSSSMRSSVIAPCEDTKITSACAFWSESQALIMIFKI